MVKVIMGLKGSGKTKQLVKDINEAVQSETGSVVCVEFGKKLTYDIDYRVRLIDAKEYNITDVTLLKGFISGLHAGNFDITHVFIESLYKLIGEDRATGGFRGLVRGVQGSQRYALYHHHFRRARPGL